MECGEQQQMRSQKGSGEQTWEQLATQKVPMTNSGRSVVTREKLKRKEVQEPRGFQGEEVDRFIIINPYVFRSSVGVISWAFWLAGIDANMPCNAG